MSIQKEISTIKKSFIKRQGCILKTLQNIINTFDLQGSDINKLIERDVRSIRKGNFIGPYGGWSQFRKSSVNVKNIVLTQNPFGMPFDVNINDKLTRSDKHILWLAWYLDNINISRKKAIEKLAIILKNNDVRNISFYQYSSSIILNVIPFRSWFINDTLYLSENVKLNKQNAVTWGERNIINIVNKLNNNLDTIITVGNVAHKSFKRIRKLINVKEKRYIKVRHPSKGGEAIFVQQILNQFYKVNK